ncbi:MAG: riboflavin biosynthesis protein RibD [Betaproteobacteria bacterium HGW-Betaproteobacteria-22]|nr:MAG: riboflavin biosynthesis protein RibD [Betaproteobacteria bacterium HGW-Betaproteobacteria-22]
MSSAITQDWQWMSYALRLAERGLYTTQPNPRVGCVVVRNNQVVGAGAHLKAGEPHAEVYALQQAGALAQESDIYITLEPCSHFGRTPPCVQAVIAAKPKRVIVAMQDPNPLVSGKGIAALREQGVEVVVGLMETQAHALNAGFVSRMKYGLPYIRSKIAASLDGRTALKNGKSQWITGEAARRDVQHWRAQSCVTMTGIGTVLADDPSMTVRLENASRQPMRVIVDSALQTPVKSRMLVSDSLQIGSVLIAYAQDVHHRAELLLQAGAELLHLPDAQHTRVDLPVLMAHLAQRGVNEVLVEAGQGLNGALLQAGLIDALVLYYAPKFMGAEAKGMFANVELTEMLQVPELVIDDVRQFAQDIRILARPIKPKSLKTE